MMFTPRGDGHSVLVLPGWRANDVSTVPLRAYLRTRGYDVHGWGLGVYQGPSRAIEIAAGRRLSDLADAAGEPVSLVGWSLGGTLACTLARQHTDIVRQVITLGSPHPQVAQRPLPIPVTSIYSRDDRIVTWQRSRIPENGINHNIEVHGGHLGLGTNPAVLHAVADRLARIDPIPFHASRIWDAAYPDPSRT